MMDIDAIGRVCHEANRAYCTVVGDPGLPAWDDLDESYRESTRMGVRNALAGSTPKESHMSWLKERVGAGWVLGPKLDRQAKIHPNLVPYEQLPESQKRKDHLFVAVVRALNGKPTE